MLMRQHVKVALRNQVSAQSGRGGNGCQREGLTPRRPESKQQRDGCRHDDAADAQRHELQGERQLARIAGRSGDKVDLSRVDTQPCLTAGCGLLSRVMRQLLAYAVQEQSDSRARSTGLEHNDSPGSEGEGAVDVAVLDGRLS